MRLLVLYRALINRSHKDRIASGSFALYTFDSLRFPRMKDNPIKLGRWIFR